MEKRALIAIALSFVILFGWQLLFPPPKREIQPPAPVSGPAPATTVPNDVPPAPPGAVVPSAAASEATAAASAEELNVETNLFHVLLTNQGARIVSWKLKKYTSAGEAVELVPAFARRDRKLPLAVDLESADLARVINDALFRVEREPVFDGKDRPAGERIRFLWADGMGLQVEKSLVFRDDDYLVDVNAEVVDRGRGLPVRLTWGPGLEAGGSGAGQIYSGQIYYAGYAVYRNGGRTIHVNRKDLKAEVPILESGTLQWAGLEEQFFAALILPADSKGGAVIRSELLVPQQQAGEASNGKEPKREPQFTVAVTIPPEGAQLFVGPKKYAMLRQLGHDLESVVWFSDYAPVYWPAKVLFLALIWLHDHLVPNYGLAIILATIALRLLLFPLNQYSMVNMRKVQAQMQKIQPKINAIKSKYRKIKDAQSRAKMNEEMMALYRKEGVNPMGGMSGCLPLLIQFPILIAFYNMLNVAIELRGAPFFGWILDLTQKDPFYVTPLLMGGTMFWQQKMTMAKGGDPMQQRIMLMMPLVFTVMFLNLPSGLVLYWCVNNLLGIGQQWLVNRHIGRLDVAAQKG